jgi:abortive infection bacteriophage resistance protein
MATGPPLRLPYQKSYLTVSDQVLLLQHRQMVIDDPAAATQWLRRVGYYRFSGYAYPFRKSQIHLDPVTGTTSIVVADDFQSGATFQQVIDLYDFDKCLRGLYLDAIEIIEVALRVEIALLLGARSAYAHHDPMEFDRNFSLLPSLPTSKHAAWLANQTEKFRRSNEEFVRHFKARYQGNPPIWMAIELWDFGMMSVLLGGMKSRDKMRLSAGFNLARPDILPSWTRNLNVVRNICAHHGRLWNRSLASVHPILPRQAEVPGLDHLVADRSAQARIYGSAAAIQHLLSFIHPGSDWKYRLAMLMKSFPRAGGISQAQAGFPKDWESIPLWN